MNYSAVCLPGRCNGKSHNATLSLKCSQSSGILSLRFGVRDSLFVRDSICVLDINRLT